MQISSRISQQLTPQSTDPLLKQTAAQSAKKSPKFYRAHMFIMICTSPSLVPILSQISPIHMLLFYFLKIYLKQYSSKYNTSLDKTCIQI